MLVVLPGGGGGGLAGVAPGRENSHKKDREGPGRAREGAGRLAAGKGMRGDERRKEPTQGRCAEPGWQRWQAGYYAAGYYYVAGIDAGTILASDCLQQQEAELAVTPRPGSVTAG